MLSDAEIKSALVRAAGARGQEIWRLRAALRQIIQRHADIKEAVDYLAPDLSAEDLALHTGLEQGAAGAAQIAAKAMEGKDD